ncbi:transglutaminase family protein [Mameliella sediminis]|uniref:transglutaminase family protein n=1 Tax=Mameliella sediminis TaxID=2836866 RepID=UPI001C479FB9|nr:transglutaminase family protein [Mameliella sediminis]MBY6117182.1 transglutaminase family protein [Antarctobacter heliothermus]MBY6147038.1 transglutaminase family protein [Mameliella alba]MBV7396592.1 transglutaminase family protein [Mameliella sediminis]MBY6162881.1 transglutaminase family protein [Mameliella alba]MBY6171145.1 transglutaminase family protein [Mameliella alba]
MNLNIRHTTRYRFDDPVSFGLQQLRKTPKSSYGQNVLRWDTTVTGGKLDLTYTDHHQNTVNLIEIERGTQELVITCEGEVEVADNHGVLGRHVGPVPLWLYRRVTPQTKAGQGVRALIRGLGGETELERAHALMAAVAEAVRYEVGSSQPDWTAEDALTEGRGVCQDHAHVFIACAREMGMPARYVSGYLMLDHTTEQDAMHAWAEAHVQGLGWVGFDCSNCISPDQRYVRVATGMDYHDAAPVRGTRNGGTTETLDVEIEVAQQ